MKTIASIIAATSLVVCFGSLASAAGGSKPTLESCQQLAIQRGMATGNGNANRTRREFISNCMKGKQQ